MRCLAGLLSTLGLIGLLALGCQPAPAPPARPAAPAAAPVPAPLQKVTVAIVSPTEVFAVPWIGKESGVFLKHGFDVEVPLVTGSPRLVQSLIAGDFDYVMPGVSAVVRARLQGADPVLLATTTDFSNQNLVVHPRANIRTLADLRGKLIGLSQLGSDADTFLDFALDRAGLKVEDVSKLQTGGHPQTLAALVSGNLDVGVLGTGNLLAAEQVGATKLASAREYRVYGASGALTTTRAYVERDRDKVLRFMRAWVEAVHYYRTHREESIRVLQANLSDLPADQLAFLYDDVLQQLQPLPLVSEEGMQFLIDREEDPRARSLKPGELLDMSFLREIERGGYLNTLSR